MKRKLAGLLRLIQQLMAEPEEVAGSWQESAGWSVDRYGSMMVAAAEEHQ